MTKIILEFENKIYTKNYTKNDILHRKLLTIKDLFINVIDKTYIYEFTNNIDNYYYFKDNKLINPDTNIINNGIIHNDTIYFKCYRKQYGGNPIVDVLKSVINTLLNVVFKPIIDPIMMIVNVFIMLIKLIEWIGKFIVWYVFFVIWLFTDLLNPVNFAADFFNSLMILVLTICKLPFDILFALLTFSINIVGGWMQGFWGWDQSSLTQLDRDSNYFHKVNQKNGKKCYLTNTNKVPFSIILGTILCPPIGVFMDLGMTGWLNIIICALLTLLFYIPGLTYALLIIYS